MARQQQKNLNAPVYRALVDSFIDGVLLKGGSGKEVEYWGMPGANLEPVNDAAKKVAQQVEAIEKAHHKGMLDKDQRRAALASLSDDLNEVNPASRRVRPDYDEPLSDAERKVLEKHAKQTVADTAKAQQADANFTGVKLQGSNNPTTAEKQGATPVTDAKK
jgi:hypothetical protein